MTGCAIARCAQPHVAQGLCNAHYKRARKGQDMQVPLGSLRPKGISLVRDELGRKRCVGCGEWLPEASYSRGGRNFDGLYSHCRPCHRLRKRLSRFRGLTADGLRSMLAGQGGVCAGCSTSDPGGHGEWHIDHDHRCCPGHSSCGECIRGLLCSACNAALGFAQDDPTVLRALADYLERNPA